MKINVDQVSTYSPTSLINDYCFRENNQIIGSYLEIEDITLEDYGEYKCEVSNGVDEEITLPAHVYRQGNGTFEPCRGRREKFSLVIVSSRGFHRVASGRRVRGYARRKKEEKRKERRSSTYPFNRC